MVIGFCMIESFYHRKKSSFCKSKSGDSIPTVHYTAEELATWKIIYQKLSILYPSHACKQHISAMKLLEKECGYGDNAIPQLEAVSRFLKSETLRILSKETEFMYDHTFLLRTVRISTTPSGWSFDCKRLSRKSGLSSFSVYSVRTTQFDSIAHTGTVIIKPFYFAKPTYMESFKLFSIQLFSDCVHELIGHVPLLSDKEFAEFSQEIGLASLGVSDTDIIKLSTVKK
jgi:phenylalanine-4-hydroxylase